MTREPRTHPASTVIFRRIVDAVYTRTLDIAPSTISHHLSALEQAGLVRHTRQGRYRWYESTGERWAIASEAELAAGVV